MSAKTGQTITLQRICGGTPERVFRAWTEPDLMKRWWIPDRTWAVRDAETDVRVGGKYRVEFGPRDEAPFVEEGEYRELDPPHRVAYVEHVTREGESQHGPGLTTVTFRDLGSERTEVTVSTVVNAGEEPDARSAGWTVALHGLAEVFRRGEA